MKLATRRTLHPDGELLVVSRDASRAVSAREIAPSLHVAISRWNAVSKELSALAARLETGDVPGTELVDVAELTAPLPRMAQWLDASAFKSHGRLMAEAFKMPDVTPEEWPLMYQGLSDHTYGPREPVRLPAEEDGIDFEGEFAVVLDETPMGVTEDEALGHVKLVLLANDWSLRAFGPREMRAGFGFIHAKPATAFAPFAVTPDELGDAWQDGRVCLDLVVHRGDMLVGRPNGLEMSYGFGQLIAHAAYNRRLSAGTVIGSGTVSNAAYPDVGSTCLAEVRSIEAIERGAPETQFLRFGERVTMDAIDAAGRSPFGSIEQTVLSARNPHAPVH